MRKGAMSIYYVVALLLGVVVLTVFGYWFYSTYIKGGQGVNEARCNTLKVEYCTLHTDELWHKVNTDCGAWTNCKEFCSNLMPGWVTKNPTRCR